MMAEHVLYLVPMPLTLPLCRSPDHVCFRTPSQQTNFLNACPASNEAHVMPAPLTRHCPSSRAKPVAHYLCRAQCPAGNATHAASFLLTPAVCTHPLQLRAGDPKQIGLVEQLPGVASTLLFALSPLPQLVSR
jgi:hypothetical protein